MRPNQDLNIGKFVVTAMTVIKRNEITLIERSVDIRISNFENFIMRIRLRFKYNYSVQFSNYNDSRIDGRSSDKSVGVALERLISSNQQSLLYTETHLFQIRLCPDQNTLNNRGNHI